MNRKQFIELNGATCDNWTWSWSFVNNEKQFVIFGMWERYEETNTYGLILSKKWEHAASGKRNNGFGQALRHLDLVLKNGYKLFTFVMKEAPKELGENENGPAKISGFVPELLPKNLIVIEGDFFASQIDDEEPTADASNIDQKFIEGGAYSVVTTGYERDPKARRICLEHHGYKCEACHFDFENVYGDLGRNFIHVHHKAPLGEVGIEHAVDPIQDLIPLCPNCHAMVHRTKPALEVDALKVILNSKALNVK